MEKRESDCQELKTWCETAQEAAKLPKVSAEHLALGSSDSFQHHKPHQPPTDHFLFPSAQSLHKISSTEKQAPACLWWTIPVPCLAFLSSWKGAELEPSIYLIIYDLRKH